MVGKHVRAAELAVQRCLESSCSAGGQADGVGRACRLEAFEGEADGDWAFTDGGGDTLDGAAAHVADGEYAGPAGFQEQWCQVLVPQPGGRDVAAGQEETVPVFGQLARQPGRCAANCRGTASGPGYGAVYSADGCVTRTESHSWPPHTAARVSYRQLDDGRTLDDDGPVSAATHQNLLKTAGRALACTRSALPG